MYTKSDLMTGLAALNIDPRGTLLVHSSMKAIGPVKGGAETVLDADVSSEDFGYPVMVSLPFGDMVIAYFTATSERPVPHINVIRWRPPDD